jgi:two-component system chemotaxis sensor kinase CheA
MTIRSRIILFVTLTFLAIAFIGGYAVFQSRNNAIEVQQVTGGVMPSVLASSDLIAQVREVQLSAMALVIEKDSNLVTQALERLKTNQDTLGQALEFQMKNASSQAQKGLVEQAQESLGNYFDSINTVVNMKVAGKNDMAEALFFGNVVQYQIELSQIVDTMRIEKNRQKDDSVVALNNNLSTTTTTITGITIFVIAGLIALGYGLYRQIVVPMSRMQKTMSEIASSQDFTRSVEVDRMDEIGHSIVAFNAMIGKIQETSLQVRQKTTDMQIMLQNIPQGILTITDGNTIHPEYSVFLETILDTNDIAGKDIMTVLFSNTKLSDDVLSQVEAVAGACIGEDLMNFEFNAHLMVGEIEKTMADGRIKVLDLSWSPITDEHDTIVRLMLCVRDVTELRKLVAKANEQKQELEIIGEILSVSPEKFNAFLSDAGTLLADNEKVVQEHQDIAPFAIAKMFRNMHTIKGNARTYGLLHLAGIVHNVEQHYDDLRHPESGVIWEQPVLLAQLAQIKAVVERYRKINKDTLGRLGTGELNGDDRYILIDRKHIQDSVHRLETVNTSNIHELIAARDAVRKMLRLLGTEKIQDVLSDVTKSLPALASDLGKEEPAFDIEDNGFVINNRVAGVLKDIFMHLVRNSMDHGLEDAQERIAKGKLAAGRILLQAGLYNDKFQMALEDDGRGMALQRIKAIGVEKGLIAADAQLNDNEIASLILRPGFSTKEVVTDVSGRGVGMDAVHDFVKRENGEMDIQFTDDKVGADYRQFMIVVKFPENFAVEVDGFDTPDADEDNANAATPAVASVMLQEEAQLI